MLRLFFVLLLTSYGIRTFGQQHSVAVGIYGGMTVPYSLNGGMDKDPRYKSRYNVKAQPVGLQFTMDYENVGFQISPGVFTLGQDYYVVNTSGGQDGKRDIDLNYVILPLTFKLHLIDLSIFRVSAVATGGIGYLYGASDVLTHDYTKLKFPSQTFPLLPQPPYMLEYDGVVSPATKLEISEKSDYKPLQLFAGIGLTSDWNVTEKWRLTFDVKVHYGFTDPRNSDYKKRIKQYESVYELPGNRSELFAQVSIGVARFLDFDKSDRDREKNLKGKKKFHPKKQMMIKPTRRQPKH